MPRSLQSLPPEIILGVLRCLNPVDQVSLSLLIHTEMVLTRQDVNCSDETGDTMIHHLARRDMPKTLERFIQRSLVSYTVNTHGQTPLHIAIEKHSSTTAEVLIQSGCPLDSPDDTGARPLHYAATTQNWKIALLLIEKGACPLYQDVTGQNPLHVAAANGNIDIVRLVLSCNIDIMQRDVNGLTPLHLSALSSDAEIAKLLVQHDPLLASLDLADQQGLSAFYHAAYWGNDSMLFYLLELGIPVNSQSATGWTALHYAVQGGHERLVRRLLQANARVDISAQNIMKPIDLARMMKEDRIIKILSDFEPS